jgi:hypothetical protein
LFVCLFVCCIDLVIKLLDENYPGKWIGYDGPIPWSPMLPDLASDFLLWGLMVMKDAIYVPALPNSSVVLDRVGLLL